MDDEKTGAKPEDTKVEEAEAVGLEGLAPKRADRDQPPAEDTHTPHDDA